MIREWFRSLFHPKRLPSHQQMRDMGYSADAKAVELSEPAFRCFCAWVNVAPEKMPWQTRYSPPETAKAWERVASVKRSEDR